MNEYQDWKRALKSSGEPRWSREDSASKVLVRIEMSQHMRDRTAEVPNDSIIRYFDVSKLERFVVANLRVLAGTRIL